MAEKLYLNRQEQVSFSLRSIYEKFGYTRYKMSKFEEYDLYSKNKDFLVSEGVISFTDTDGKLLALKPDVTLSIINNARDLPGVEKLYYNENVYRISGDSHSYKEIMQTGIECIGDVTEADRQEVTLLAAESLALISQSFKLCLSHTGLLLALLDEYQVADKTRETIFTALAEKNAQLLENSCTAEQFAALSVLLTAWDDAVDALVALREIAKAQQTIEALTELEAAVNGLTNAGYGANISVDFSINSNNGYYSGIVFKGFVDGIAERVLSGGQYDKLMEKMGKKSSAIGFAVYLDTLERYEEQPIPDGKPIINVALPKGRLGEKVYAMFEAAGFDCPAIRENNRKLTFENQQVGIRFFWVKPSDVAIYVERGAADIGVAGKDILLEYAPDVFELLDLNMGKCRMAVAAKQDFVDDPSKTLRVATKFSGIAKKFYKEKCRDIDIIHLNGSIELAPILGLSDVIVDIVETGKTLLENNLEPIETIVPISARLISNKASYQFKTARIEQIKAALSQQVVKTDD